MKSNSFAMMMNLLGAILLVSIASVANALTKSDFPPHFLFGASTSAYQVHLVLHAKCLIYSFNTNFSF